MYRTRVSGHGSSLRGYLSSIPSLAPRGGAEEKPFSSGSHCSPPRSTNAAPAARSSTTARYPARWYSDRNPAFSWSATDASGIAGYSYVLDQALNTAADTVIDSAAASAAFEGVQDGGWFFHVRARDVAGNWGETRSVPVRIDTLGPRTLAQGSVRAKRGTWATLPYAVSDNLSAKMKVTIVVRRKGSTVLTVPVGQRRAGTHRCVFRCRLAKRTYTYAIRAVDEAGNRQRVPGRDTLAVY